MTKSIEYDLGGETITVQVSTHDDFVQCLVDEPSPFKRGQTLFNSSIDITTVKTVVIKCFIEEGERRKLINKRESAQMIFHEIVPQFIKETWPHDELVEAETYFCNHYEEQYKYIFVTPEKEATPEAI